MKTLRCSYLICISIATLGIVSIILLPLLPLEERYYNCVIGLLTGLISGAFLAAVTSLSELIIRSRKQKTMLRDFCLALSGCMRQLAVSFAFAAKYEMSPKLFSQNLGCVNGPGMQYANLICTEIDESLFICKCKKNALKELRSIATNLGPQIVQMNYKCEIINKTAQMIDLKQQGTFGLHDGEAEVLSRKLDVEIDELLNEIDSIENDLLNKIDYAVLVIYGEKNHNNFRSQLAQATSCISSHVEEIIKQSARWRS